MAWIIQKLLKTIQKHFIYCLKLILYSFLVCICGVLLAGLAQFKKMCHPSTVLYVHATLSHQSSATRLFLFAPFFMRWHLYIILHFTEMILPFVSKSLHCSSLSIQGMMFVFSIDDVLKSIKTYCLSTPRNFRRHCILQLEEGCNLQQNQA